MMGIDAKGLVLNTLFGHWGKLAPIGDGYTIVVPSPADMPFLLQFALEGLENLDLEGCVQVIVIGDGSADDSALRRVVERSGNPRIEMASVSPLTHVFVHGVPGMRRPGGGVGMWTHWGMVVEGIRRARGEYVFIHDADAFFVDADAIRRQYHECLERHMVTLGVTARNDPFLEQQGRTLPGTWELMFSNQWARGYAPIDHKGRYRSTPSGVFEFDNMLYPQFMHGQHDAVGVTELPARILHFAGTIVTYRSFRDRAGRPVVDEVFRLLFLALLEDLIPDPGRPRVMLTVDELARGLTDPSAPVTYGSKVAIQEYPIFRAMIDDLCVSPVMQGARGDRIKELIHPFDDHFAAHQADPTLGSLVGHRRNGLG